MRRKAMPFCTRWSFVLDRARRADIPVNRRATGDDGKKHFRLHDEGAGL